MALLGANGAGKSTTLKAISNLLQAERGEVTKGRIQSRRAGRRAHAQRPGAARRHPGDGGPPLLRPSHGRGEPADRRLHPRRRQAPRSPTISRRSTTISRGSSERSEPGRLHLGRRAADDGDRPRADEPAQDHPARRAVDGPGAAARRGDLRDRRRTSTSRKACRSCWPSRTPTWRCATPIRLHPGERPRRARRRRREPARERGREGILSRHRRRGPPLVPRRQALPAAQALAASADPTPLRRGARGPENSFSRIAL